MLLMLLLRSQPAMTVTGAQLVRSGAEDAAASEHHFTKGWPGTSLTSSGLLGHGILRSRGAGLDHREGSGPLPTGRRKTRFSPARADGTCHSEKLTSTGALTDCGGHEDIISVASITSAGFFE
jgi:hypothetical protein